MKGTTQNIIKQSKLYSYAIYPPYPKELEADLSKNKVFEQIAHFGKTIHVIGTQEQLMHKALEALNRKHTINYAEINPDLEDIFVHITVSSTKYLSYKIKILTNRNKKLLT